MSALDVFQYGDHQVRTITIDGEPWFVASDVSSILGYRMASDMTRRLDDDEKGTRSVRTPGGEQSVAVVSEPGLYASILGSRVHLAKNFKRWVTHDVLPTIRRTGRYGSDVDLLAQLPSSQMLQLAAEAAKRAEEAEHELEEARPKVEAYDAFMDADGTYSIGAVAKMLGMSQNKLFAKLRNERVLIAKGAQHNVPYQHYMHHFSVKPYPFTRRDGTTGTSYTTTVQPSGVDFIRRKLDLVTALN